MKYELPNNRKLVLSQDEYVESPREWDNLGTMCCFHGGYNLGDNNHGHEALDFYKLQKRKDVIVLPLYLYDHSGITMNTTGFSCKWDSGQVGFIYITKDKIRKEYGVKKVSAKLKEQVINSLINEVKIYDEFLTGDVYMFQIIKTETCNLGCEHEETEDSCGGFYGDDIKTNGVLDHLGEADKKHIVAELG